MKAAVAEVFVGKGGCSEGGVGGVRVEAKAGRRRTGVFTDAAGKGVVQVRAAGGRPSYRRARVEGWCRMEGGGGKGFRVGAWLLKGGRRAEDGGVRRREVREGSFKDGDAA